ncbi:MAG: complex I subunit 4 family protein [Gaiellaceae bacterium]
MTITTSLILLPLIGAFAVWLLPARREWVGGLALLVALIEVAIWIEAVIRFPFTGNNATLQFQDRHVWFTDNRQLFHLSAAYDVGLYAFSLWLVGLTVVVMAAAIGYAVWAGRERPNAYYPLMLLVTGAVVTVFAAQDLLLFYVAFEAMLIPLYLLVGVWGGAGRQRATFKFVAYTIAGSLLMLVSIIALGFSQGACASGTAGACFDMTSIHAVHSNWIFLGFAVAFAVKAPLFPLHGWMADAYRESSPEVAAVLSGIVSKAAVFGFLRIAFPYAAPSMSVRNVVLALAAIGLVYGSLVAFRAPDLRGVVAYSSLAQMSLITLGIFAFNDLGLRGSVLQMVNHGLISASLFLIVGGIERRTSTGELARLGGMARGRPILATLLMTLGIIALAVPGSSNFAGEFLILAGVFRQGWGWAAAGLVAVVLAAMYMLRLISAVLHRDVGSAVPDEALDVRPAELGILAPLVAALLVLSVWPAGISQHSIGCVDQLTLGTVPQFGEMTCPKPPAALPGARQ